MRQYHRSVQLGIAVFTSLLLLYFGPRVLFRQSSAEDTAGSRDFSFPDFHISHDGLRDIHNETLGFQEVFVISLPARTDKRDAMAVQAGLSNIRYTLMQGVESKTVAEKALPYTMEIEEKAIGCWRAHMNVLQDMVERRVSSALIFEDDADWDVSLRSQLVQFGRGARYLQNIHHGAKVRAPYGEDWDMFWLGHCGSFPDKLDRRRFVIPHDNSVMPPEIRLDLVGDPPDLSPWDSSPESDNRTRIVYTAKGGVCLTGYAISLRGAEKALYHMSMLPYNAAVDWGYSDMCRDHSSNFTCIGIYPQLVGMHRVVGNSSKNSDIGYGPEFGRQIDEKARTEGIVFPTRLNVDRLLLGAKTFQSQFPDYTGTNLTIEQIGSAIGHPELLPEEDPEPTEVSEE